MPIVNFKSALKGICTVHWFGTVYGTGKNYQCTYVAYCTVRTLRISYVLAAAYLSAISAAAADESFSAA